MGVSIGCGNRSDTGIVSSTLHFASCQSKTQEESYDNTVVKTKSRNLGIMQNYGKRDVSSCHSELRETRCFHMSSRIPETRCFQMFRIQKLQTQSLQRAHSLADLSQLPACLYSYAIQRHKCRAHVFGGYYSALHSVPFIQYLTSNLVAHLNP